MKSLKQAFARWKEKHWDEQVFSQRDDIPWFGFDRPPLRAFWEQYKELFFKVGPWLCGLIGGAIILKLIGLA